jgi:hypothetical protein
VPGGWPALYKANRPAIGPDPGVIHPGTVLILPRAAAVTASRPSRSGQSSPAVAPAPSPQQAVPAAVAAGALSGTATGGGARPSAPRAGTASGLMSPGSMPKWLEDVLLAVGLLAATAFAAEPAAAYARRRQGGPGLSVPSGLKAATGRRARLARRAAARAKIILAEYDRLIVTYCAVDHTVYVFTPPGEDPRAVLRAARLVLPEDTYEDLAGRLGVPSAWPRE